MIDLWHKERIWLAGFIDGEGYIGIVRKGNTRFQAQVRIATTHKETMEYIAKLLDGHLVIHKSSKHKPQWKPAYCVVIYDQRAENLCRLLLPYLVTKRLQAENLLEYRKTIKFGRNQFSPPLKVDRSIYWKKSKELNQRGVA